MAENVNNDEARREIRSLQVETFHQEVKALITKGMTPTAAHNQVCRTREDLRSAMVEDYNLRQREKAAQKTRRK